MFNLLMSGNGWVPNRQAFGRGRTLEYTDADVVARFKPDGVLDLASVALLPTLFVAETRYDNSQDSARVGTLTRVRLGAPGADYQLEYTFDHDIPSISNAKLLTMAGELGIEQFEFSRTHWAIKDVDLFKVLLKQIVCARSSQPHSCQRADSGGVLRVVVPSLCNEQRRQQCDGGEVQHAIRFEARDHISIGVLQRTATAERLPIRHPAVPRHQEIEHGPPAIAPAEGVMLRAVRFRLNIAVPTTGTKGRRPQAVDAGPSVVDRNGSYA